MRRQQAEWRKIRGESLPEDEELLRPSAGGKGDQVLRDSWMTELPPERAPPREGVIPVVTSVTAFSRRGITGRGDTAQWTDTPQQAADRQQQLLLGGPSVDHLNSTLHDRQERERLQARISAVEEYNQKHRPKSLLEQHQARPQTPEEVGEISGGWKRSDD